MQFSRPSSAPISTSERSVMPIWPEQRLDDPDPAPFGERDPTLTRASTTDLDLRNRVCVFRPATAKAARSPGALRPAEGQGCVTTAEDHCFGDRGAPAAPGPRTLGYRGNPHLTRSADPAWALRLIGARGEGNRTPFQAWEACVPASANHTRVVRPHAATGPKSS